MLRGFLNALDAHDKTCSNFFICQAAQESSKAGQFGQLLAKVASSNAESWLTSINATLHMGTMNAGLHGVNEIITEQGCELNFPCKNFQKTFKKPKLLWNYLTHLIYDMSHLKFGTVLKNALMK